LPPASNALPEGHYGAGSTIPSYVGFLLVGFALPRPSPVVR